MEPRSYDSGTARYSSVDVAAVIMLIISGDVPYSGGQLQAHEMLAHGFNIGSTLDRLGHCHSLVGI